MPKTILIAEDEPLIQRLVTAIIEPSGFDCECVGDGAACLARLAAGPDPDLLLLDLMMPGTTGIEVLEALHATHGEDRFPIAVFSGKNEQETVKLAIKLGADDFILKPFDPAELVKRVNDLVFTIDEISLRSLLGKLRIPDDRLSSVIGAAHPWWRGHDAFAVNDGDGTLCVAVPREKAPQTVAKASLEEIQRTIAVFRRCAGGWRKVWPRLAAKAA